MEMTYHLIDPPAFILFFKFDSGLDRSIAPC